MMPSPLNLKQMFIRLHWAGTEAADCWPGYIDGAVQSGIRAAEEILFYDEKRPEMVTSSFDCVYEQQNIYFAQDKENSRFWTKAVLFVSAAVVLSGLISNRYIRISWNW